MGMEIDKIVFLEHLQPKNIVKSIFPKWNQLVWFEVTEASHHQVKTWYLVLQSAIKLLTFASSTGSWNLKRGQITFVGKRLVSRRPTIPKTALRWTQNATKAFWRFTSEHACSTILCKFEWLFHNFSCFFQEGIELHDWVNPSYLDPLVQSEIQTKFETDSEIELTNFLLPEKLAAVQEALRTETLKWKKNGPPNKRYGVLTPKKAIWAYDNLCLK